MKNQFHLGKNFYLPETIITETIAVLGIRGSGKTTTAKDIVEEALKRKRQVAIIDPTDAWWGLKSGFEIVVFGGAHGDLPLDEASGKLIADFVVDYGVSVILSLRHLRKAAQKRLITAFNEQLYFRKGEASKRTPVLVVIDECDAFIPQKVMGEDAKSVGAVEDLVRRGRNAGIGVVLISQRAASINKDVLTQITVLVSHKHTSPQDRKALEEWIRGHDSEDRARVFLDSLASLPVGTAWVWAPDLDLFEKVAIRKSETFDSSATPKLGEKVSRPKILKPVDLAQLKEQMKEAVTEHENNDPKKLKEKIRQLEDQVRKLTIDLAEAARSTLSKEYVDNIKEHIRTVQSALDSLEAVSRSADFSPKRSENKSIFREMRTKPMSINDIKTNRFDTPVKFPDGGENGKLTSGVKRILTVLAQDPGGMPVARIAIRAGFPQNSTLRNYMSQARVNGWIEGTGQSVRISRAGEQILGDDYERIPTESFEILKYWQSKVSRKQAEILGRLWHSPRPIEASTLAAEIEMEMNSTWRNYISQLRTLGLVEGSKELSLSRDFK